MTGRVVNFGISFSFFFVNSNSCCENINYVWQLVKQKKTNLVQDAIVPVLFLKLNKFCF